jgi:uncharacterized protein Smg (DUF494 family)
MVMKEKVVEILVYLMNEIRDDRALGEIDLSELRERGYTQSEISTAFSWLHDHFGETAGDARQHARADAGSRRMLHEAEKMMLSVEAQGLLIHLRELGLLQDRELEIVIERAMMSGYERLTMVDVQGLVASVILSRGGDNAGHPAMLNNGDSIH